MVLHSGAIAEMKTGEGKTLTATLAVFLNSLAGKSVHVVTVNDYLARRDAEWMRPLYDALGVEVGVIQDTDLPDDPERRHAAYAADVTYGTNSEFGFDYLRDNMASDLEGCFQRDHNFAIVDEVDNILIDEARTPLIISGAPEQAAELYHTFARLAKQMVGEESKPKLKALGESKDTSEATYDYEYDEKHKTVAPTEGGVEKAEKFLGVDNLYLSEHGTLVNHLVQSLKAESLYRRDKDYAVVDGEVMIIDEFTGRILEGRRWSEGLHQAVEAKEGARAARGEPDAGDDHPAELLPPLRQAQRHDRHRAHRGDRVHEDLQDAGGRGPDQPRHGPRRPERPDLQDQGRQVEGGRQRDRRAPRDRPAGPRRHRLGRGLGDALRAVQATRDQARRPQREARARPARGRDGRPGRPPRLGHDRDQHGGPRRRHQARRRPRADGAARAPQARPLRGRRGLGGGARAAHAPSSRRRCKEEGDAGARARRAVHLRHRAARVAPDRQPAPRPRRPPGRPGRHPLLPQRRGRPRAPVRRRPDLQDPRPARPSRRARRGVPARGEDADQADRVGAEEGRGAELPHP